jgi:prepilin-type N-terminal cleavage/methylation domain-containing protein
VKRKREKSGLTLVELLIVLAVISLLVGLLIPAVSAVKNSAMEAKQKGQFFAIDVALTAFKDDYSDYPPSDWLMPPTNYCGAQKLCEALLGWDLLGFHPKSEFTADGRTSTGVFLYDTTSPVLMGERKEPYLELGTQTAFKLGGPNGIFAGTGTGPLAPDTYVLCDVFGKTKVTLPGGKAVNAGAPILYYKADTSGTMISAVYRINDNDGIVAVKETADGKLHPLGGGAPPAPFASRNQYFYGIANPDGTLRTPGYITDPKITAKLWPYRPGSYILISAGADGIYGTPDDIRNFGD